MLKHITPETTSVDNYLLDLRDELSGQVPEHKLDEILAETESHLRERAEAFEELGLGNPEAEAVRTFVATSTYAAQMSSSAVSDRRAEKVRKVQRWVVTCLPFVGAAALWGESPGIPAAAMLALPAPLLLTVVAALAFASRRSQAQRIVAAGALAGGLAFTYFGFYWVETENFTGPRTQAHIEAANWHNAAESHRQRMLEVDMGRWVFAQNNPQVPPLYRRRPGLYVIPPKSALSEMDATAPSFGEAKQAWKERGGTWMSWVRSSVRHYYDQAQQYRETLEGPPFRTGIAGKAAQISIAFSLLILLTDLLMARLGEALFWRRRNRKRSKLGSA